MAYGGFKDLIKRTASDKILRGKAFNVAKNTKCDGCQCGLPSIVYKCFDKKNFRWICYACIFGGLSYAKEICCWKWKYFKQRVSWRITQTNY